MSKDYDDPADFIAAMLELHPVDVVQNFIAIYNGQPGVGLIRVKIGGVETSAIGVQHTEDGPVHLLFLGVVEGMTITTTDGQPAKSSHFDEHGNMMLLN